MRLVRPGLVCAHQNSDERIPLSSSAVEFTFNDVVKLGECEFAMISEMNSQLILHHPYRTLTELYSKLRLSQEEHSLAWSIINDHYLTDLPLLYPPHVIAVTAIFLAVTLKNNPGDVAGVANAAASLSVGQLASSGIPTAAGTNGSVAQQKKVEDLVRWLAEGEVNLNAVIECLREVISLYDVLDQYNEKACKEQISRYVKAKSLEK